MSQKINHCRSFLPRLNQLECRYTPSGLNELVSVAEQSLYSEAAAGRLEYDVGFSPSSAPSSSSVDGRFVVFSSKNGNLVPSQNDVNADYDVFLFDRQLQTTSLVSRRAGTQATTGYYASIQPSISDDGRYVTFVSASQDLVSNATFPTNNLGPSAFTNVFLWDRVTGANQLISHRFEDAKRGSSYRSFNPSISGNGQKIVFTSFATDLVNSFSEAGEKSKYEHYYVYDIALTSASLVDHKFGNLTAATTITNDLFTIPPRISADAQYVVFQSLGTDILPATISSMRNIYRHNCATGNNQLVSNQADSATLGANAPTSVFNISANGRWVVFSSGATNLVDNYVGSSTQVFIKDMISGATELISHQANGTLQGANGLSNALSVSPDGRFVSFLSSAPNLLNGFVDGNGPSNSDAFLYDRVNGQLVLISRAAGMVNESGNGRVFYSKMNSTGNIVIYSSRSTNAIVGFADGNIKPIPTGGIDTGYDLFAFFADTGETKLLSSQFGSATSSANAQVEFQFEITADGQQLFYSTAASDVIPGLRDNNGTTDVFHRDLTTNVATLVSRPLGGPSLSGGGESNWVQASADGRFIVFSSTATNLVPGQVDDDGTYDVFLRDRLLGTTKLVSRAFGTTATAGNDQSGMPAISADGRFIAFGSYAGNLIDGFVDNNGPSTASQGLYNNTDVFLYDRLADSMTLVSREVGTLNIGANGTSGGFNATNNSSYFIAISGDGNWVTYRSNAKNLVAGFVDNDLSIGADHGTNIYLFDRVNAVNRLVSHAYDSNTGGGTRRSYAPKISFDGRFVTYYTPSNNLVAGLVTGGGTNVFLYDRDADSNVLVSHAAVSPIQAANGGSSEPIISRDGRFVAFISAANNMIAGQVDSNNLDDVYLYDRLTAGVTLVSHSYQSATQSGNNSSDNYVVPNDVAISSDGRFIVFNSKATDLVAGFVSGNPTPSFRNDVFLYDRLTNTNTLVSHAFDSSTTGANRECYIGGLSGDGRFVFYLSSATNLIGGQNTYTGGGPYNVLVYDRVTGTSKLATHVVSNPTTGGVSSVFPVTISVDGSAIVYASDSDGLTAADFNTFADAFVYSNAPEVVSVVVNDGSAQRSIIRSITVTFDQPIQFPANPNAAFDLVGSGVSLTVTGTGDYSSSVTITFSGSDTQFGSLPDGNFSLQFHAAKIIGGGPLDGNGDGLGGDDHTFTFHRLFGDANGDRKVNAMDFATFIAAYNQPGLAFDFNNDGVVTASDFNQFRVRYGVMV